MEGFSDVTTKEMTTIIYGEDMSDEIVEVDCFEDQQGSSFKFTRKKLTFGCALTEIIRQVYYGAGFKHFNPLCKTFRAYTGLKDATVFQERVSQNASRFRAVVQKFVQRRKSVELQEKSEGGFDILTLLL